nr:cytochrome c oxidase subunit 3 [Thorea hispida]ARX95965.1 cytochrome c oxidase subunit 3 [Thorea hispida]
MIPLIKVLKSTQSHPFHLVDPSPWPLFTSLSAFGCASGAVLYMHAYSGATFTLISSFLLLILSKTGWWRDVVREASFEGHHTSNVQIGLRYGMLLFIISEVLFFFAFLWAFFHSSLSPAIEIGSIWPPKGIDVLDPWKIPFLNTLILLLSGCTITWAHHSIIANLRMQTILGLGCTLILAVVFTSFQVLEYTIASFRLADGIYGSTFYIITGFHGFHVFIGTTILLICLVRMAKYQLTYQHHFGFEAAAWYWHFVDVIWLVLFVSIYWWGGL